MKVICISGKARHGKDTVAEKLYIELVGKGKKVLIAHYGDLLKYICKTFFGWDGEKDEKGRSLLQYVGTEVIREQIPDYWVDFIVSILKLFPNEWDYVLIPDSRFPNEIERLRAAEFDTYSVRVERENFISELTAEQLAHPSETALDNYNFDCVLKNTSFKELYAAVEYLAANI